MQRLLCQCSDVALSEKIRVSVGDEKSKVRFEATRCVEDTVSCLAVATHWIGFELNEKLQNNIEIAGLDSPIAQMLRERERERERERVCVCV